MIRVNSASGMLVVVNAALRGGRTRTDIQGNLLATSPALALHMTGPTVPVADCAGGRIRRSGFIRRLPECMRILGLPENGKH